MLELRWQMTYRKLTLAQAAWVCQRNIGKQEPPTLPHCLCHAYNLFVDTVVELHVWQDLRSV